MCQGMSADLVRVTVVAPPLSSNSKTREKRPCVLLFLVPFSAAFRNPPSYGTIVAQKQKSYSVSSIMLKRVIIKGLSSFA